MNAPKRYWETKEPLSPADALRLTRELFEEAEADAASVIDNLLRGEYSRPVRVIAFNTSEG